MSRDLKKGFKTQEGMTEKNTYVACERGRGNALLDRGLSVGRPRVGVVPAAVVGGNDQLEGVGVGGDGEDVVDGDCVDGEIHHFCYDWPC